MHSRVEFQPSIRIADESFPFSDALLRIAFLDEILGHENRFVRGDVISLSNDMRGWGGLDSLHFNRSMSGT